MSRRRFHWLPSKASERAERGRLPAIATDEVVRHLAEIQLAGTWRLVATRQVLTDGTVRPEVGLGPRGIGYVIYSESGIMCGFLSNPDRPKWKVQTAPTEAELRAAFDGMVAYCGSYEVNEREGYLLHHVQMDKVPNVAGTDRKRYFTISGNRLVLRPSPLPDGIKDWTIEWERVTLR